MSIPRLPELALPSPRGPALPALARAALLGVAWVPFFALVRFGVDRFEPVLARLEEKQELPAASAWLLELGRLNAAAFGLAFVGFLALLIVCDLSLARATARRQRGGARYYWAWFAAVVLWAVAACLFFCVALLLPVSKMRAPVG
jgi:hypothetical protein